MYDDFFRRAREYPNGFAFEVQINRESPATRIFDILRERSFLFETRGARHFSIKEAVYRAAGCIEPNAHVQPGAVDHFWAEYTGKVWKVFWARKQSKRIIRQCENNDFDGLF